MSKLILIVEDTRDLMENIEESLLMEGYYVRSAPNGKIALEVMNTNKPDLIITDLLMPIMDGFEFIKSIRENSAWVNIPILVFSAMPPIENEKKIKDLGANHYLKKPSTLESLLGVVDDILVD